MSESARIRQAFMDFFEERGHKIVPSAPVYPKDDPTLLFTNAGMNQFKDVFLGAAEAVAPRVADTQKCLRVSGKHNDLEEVGRDTYHHTLFEMLGNWSFGDYFKRESIQWAWEFLTGVCGLPKDRLWVTVFAGDEADGLPADTEAEALWREVTDIPHDRILRFGRKDNFWEMGDTGPCGPCSEIHIDRGPEGCDREDGRDPAIGVNAGNERFVELWNLVFIQFNRGADGKLSALPAQHVDTGMGFERLMAVMQGKKSNYDTDLFAPIMAHIARITGATYTSSPSETDTAFRVIADHIRALTIGITDGVIPSNEGRGYVLRRLLRRASVFGNRVLGMKRPFLYELAPTVAEVLGGAFPELRQRLDHVATVIRSEEEAFGRTIDKGLGLFQELVDQLEARGTRTIPGGEAFELYATYGFPRDLIDVLASDQGLSVDQAGWEAARDAHAEASRSNKVGAYKIDPAHFEGLPATHVLFYDVAPEAAGGLEVRPLKLVERTALVLDASPFYAESGGQVGDTGEIVGDGFRFVVHDTQKFGDVIVHLGEQTEGLGELPAVVHPRLDAARRRDIMANHTATHLLHAALHRVLGAHATQQGSMVSAERLRFDFTHGGAVTPEELARVEQLVNDEVAGDHAVSTTIEDLETAKARGAMAMFGEKYDERVRVVSIGERVSTELCGGTHVSRTSQIGPFLITSEASVAAGVRRIEAVTRRGALELVKRQREALRAAAAALKTTEAQVPERVDALKARVSELSKELDALAKAGSASAAKDLLASAEKVGDVRVIRAVIDGDGDAMVGLCDELRAQADDVCGVVGARDGDKALIAVFASRPLTQRGVHAGRIVQAASAHIDGRGGGRPDFARAGGKDPNGLDAAVAAARELLLAALG